MKIVSTNLGSERTIQWKNETYTTGIYKEPVDGPIFLDNRGVRGDHINNLKVHGGLDKACYGYGDNYYEYWKTLYPDLNWTYGMFGENLTISDVDESKILIGDIYKLGESIVQVSQPRQPCNKFAAKFGSTDLIRQFIDYDHPGIYLRVIHTGMVQVGDELKLDLRNDRALSLQQIYQLVYSKKDKVDIELAKDAIFDSNLASSTIDAIKRHWKV